MQVKRNIRLIWTYYRGFIVATSAITACCAWIFDKFGLSAFFMLFWFKLATLGIVFYYGHKSKKNEVFYYQNLGLTPVTLWSFSIGIDFAVFLVTLIAVYKIG